MFACAHIFIAVCTGGTAHSCSLLWGYVNIFLSCVEVTTRAPVACCARDAPKRHTAYLKRARSSTSQMLPMSQQPRIGSPFVLLRRTSRNIPKRTCERTRGARSDDATPLTSINVEFALFWVIAARRACTSRLTSSQRFRFYAK